MKGKWNSERFNYIVATFHNVKKEFKYTQTTV
jgi:hypothetical protein